MKPHFRKKDWLVLGFSSLWFFISIFRSANAKYSNKLSTDSELPVHRLIHRSSILHPHFDEILNQELAKADPFLDDFVPNEYVDFKVQAKIPIYVSRYSGRGIWKRYYLDPETEYYQRNIWDKFHIDPESEYQKEIIRSKRAIDTSNKINGTKTENNITEITDNNLIKAINEESEEKLEEELEIDVSAFDNILAEANEILKETIIPSSPSPTTTKSPVISSLVNRRQALNQPISQKSQIQANSDPETSVHDDMLTSFGSDFIRSRILLLAKKLDRDEDAELLEEIRKTLESDSKELQRPKSDNNLQNIRDKKEQKRKLVGTFLQVLGTLWEREQVEDNEIKGSSGKTIPKKVKPIAHKSPSPLKTVINPKLTPPLCDDIEELKIKPGDDKETAREKQGALMKCYMDTTADPCDDFYQFSCGRWSKHHPIPKDRGGYDIFEILREDLSANMIKLFTSDAGDTESGEEIANQIIGKTKGESSKAERMVKTLYKSCMNKGIIEDRGAKPLLDLLDSLGGWPIIMGANEWDPRDEFDWTEMVRQLRKFNNDILIAVWVGPDGKDSNEYILQFDQSDLLLPSGEYYKLGLSHSIIQTYNNLIRDVAILLGANPDIAGKEALEIIKFETKLAEIMIPPAARRNFSEIYHKITLKELQESVPEFDFPKFLSELLPRKLNETEPVVIYALPYFKELMKLVTATEKRTVANYIIWRFVRHRINNLNDKFETVQADLYKMLFGREETPPRWKFCVQYVNGNLGNAAGSMFVKKHFDEKSKEDMESLTSRVQGVFKDMVLSVDWLSNGTKKLAEEKIDNIIHNVGYPDSIIDDEKLLEDIEGLHYNEDNFFENVLANLKARCQKEMGQLDKTVNRTVWTATPAVVNAYYSRNRNQIMFPAGILQPPFFHRHFPKAMNFGGIGVVIGHEITHGFDDKGRQFDKNGNIFQWWDHQSSVNFRDRKQCMIDQYNSYQVPSVNIKINGLNTQGENIADNGGIKQSFQAYQRWKKDELSLNENFGPESDDEKMPHLDNLNGDQLFFLNFAQVWCGNTRPEALRSKLRTAVHAPGPFRVLGTLSNSEDFASAYQCPLGSRMNPVKKCTVW